MKLRILSNLRIVGLSLSVRQVNINLTRPVGPARRTSVQLSTHLFLTNRTPRHSESRTIPTFAFQGRDGGVSRWASTMGSYICIWAARTSLSSFPSSTSSNPPNILLLLLLLLQFSRRENKALRYKYFALCIISIELSGLSIRPKLPRNPNRRRLHDGTVLVPLGYKDLRQAATTFRHSSFANLNDHSFTISPINCNQSEKPINEFVLMELTRIKFQINSLKV